MLHHSTAQYTKLITFPTRQGIRNEVQIPIGYTVLRRSPFTINTSIRKENVGLFGSSKVFYFRLMLQKVVWLILQTAWPPLVTHTGLLLLLYFCYYYYYHYYNYCLPYPPALPFPGVCLCVCVYRCACSLTLTHKRHHHYLPCT